MNYKDPVCDSCENGKWSKDEYGTMLCAVTGNIVRKKQIVTKAFAECLGADYRRRSNEKSTNRK